MLSTSLLTAPTTPNDALASVAFNLSWSAPRLPALALLSSAPEVQQILAAFPLLAIGLVGLAVAAIQLSEGRLYRTSMNLCLACVAAFVGGILQVVNALRWAYLGPAGLSRGLIIAQGICLAFLLAFKLFYLYRRSESRESWSAVDDVVRVWSWVAILATSVTDSVCRSGFRVSVTRFRGVYFASNALQLVLLLFFGAKLLLSTPFDDDRPRTRKILAVAPLLLGILLGAIVALISLVPSLLKFSETPLGRFLLLVEMYIFLLELAILDSRQSARASLSSAISISFVDDAALRDAEQRSIAERDGEEMTETPTAISGITIRRGSSVPSWYKTRSTLARERVRAEGDEYSLTQGAAPPGQVGHTLRGLVAAELASEGMEWSGRRFEGGEEEEGLGESSFEFPESVRESNASSQRAVMAGGGGGAIEVAYRRDGGVPEGASPLVRPRARPRSFVHSAEPSTWSNNLRLSHLDSSILDLGLDSVRHPFQVQPTSLEPENRPLTQSASRVDLPPRPPPPPFDTPMPPVPPLRITYNHAREDSAATVRGLRPVVEAGNGRSGDGEMQMEAYAFSRPSYTSVSAGKVEHGGRLDAETQRGRGGESTSSSAERTMSSDSTDLDAARYSSTSVTTNTSSLNLSLTHFPRPPTCPPARPSCSTAGSVEGGPSRSSAYSTMTGSSVHAHRHLVAVARDGSEFELLPPSGVGEAIGAGGGGGGAGGLDVTSLIVSEECKAQAERLRRELAGRVAPRRVPAAVEGDEVGGAALVEDLEGEVVVRQASVRSRKGGVMPAGGAPTPHVIRHEVPVHRHVDVASGAIPSQLHEGSGDGYISPLASLDGGLPSNPRPRPLPIILPPHGHPYHARFHNESGDSATSTAYDPLRPFEQPRAPPKRPTLGTFREGERGVRGEEEKRVERLREGVGGTRGKEGKGVMGGFGRGGSGRP